MIQFESAYILYLLFLIPLFALVFLLRIRRRERLLKQFGDPSLIETLLPNFSRTKPIVKFTLLTLAYACIVVALANPKMGSKVIKGERRGIDLVVCLDISNSMMAEDIQPNRLTRAKQAISKMLEKLSNDRIGIVIFAGSSYTQLPLTSDYGAAKMFLETISPEMIEVQGTAIGSAIEKAMHTLGYNEEFADKKWVKNRSRAIVVISDGENHEDNAMASASKAAKEDIMVCTIGLGLPGGAPIPIYKNGEKVDYRKDRSGNVITTQLNEKMLTQIAQSGKGIYVRAGNSSDMGLGLILNKVDELEKNNYGEQVFSDYEEQYQYFVGAAIILILLELLILERKNKYLNSSLIFGKAKKEESL